MHKECPLHLQRAFCLCGVEIDNDAHISEFGYIFDGISIDAYAYKHPTVSQGIDIRDLVVVQINIVQTGKTTQGCNRGDLIMRAVQFNKLTILAPFGNRRNLIVGEIHRSKLIQSRQGTYIGDLVVGQTQHR